MSLADLANKLQRVGAGDWDKAAAERLAPELTSDVKGATPVGATGNARDEAQVIAEGDSLELRAAYYMKFHDRFPYAHGFTESARARVRAVRAEELQKALRGGK